MSTSSPPSPLRWHSCSYNDVIFHHLVTERKSKYESFVPGVGTRHAARPHLGRPRTRRDRAKRSGGSLRLQPRAADGGGQGRRAGPASAGGAEYPAVLEEVDQHVAAQGVGGGVERPAPVDPGDLLDEGVVGALQVEGEAVDDNVGPGAADD